MSGTFGAKEIVNLDEGVNPMFLEEAFVYEEGNYGPQVKMVFTRGSMKATSWINLPSKEDRDGKTNLSYDKHLNRFNATLTDFVIRFYPRDQKEEIMEKIGSGFESLEEFCDALRNALPDDYKERECKVLLYRKNDYLRPPKYNTMNGKFGIFSAHPDYELEVSDYFRTEFMGQPDDESVSHTSFM